MSLVGVQVLGLQLICSRILHSTPDQPACLRPLVATKYAASLTMKSEASFSSCGNILQVSGVILDEINSLVPPTDKVTWIRDKVEQRSKTQTLAISGNHSPYPDPSEALWRTLLANRIRDPTKNNTHAQAPPYFSHMYNLIGDGITAPGDLPSSVPEYFRPSQDLPPTQYTQAYTMPYITNCGNASSQRSFFKSSKGYFGLANIDAKPGDIVCVVFGMSVPLMIRKFINEKQNGFVLVSDSYLHGWMDEEAIAKVENGPLPTERLTLY